MRVGPCKDEDCPQRQDKGSVSTNLVCLIKASSASPQGSPALRLSTPRLPLTCSPHTCPRLGRLRNASGYCW